MLKNSYGRQWASIVREFESAELAQRLDNLSTTLAGADVDDYNASRHQVLKLGLAQAQEQRQKYRFKFWVRSSLNTNQLLVHFLLVLQEQVESSGKIGSSSRSGMMTALQNWIDWIAMTNKTVNDVIDVGWDTNRVL